MSRNIALVGCRAIAHQIHLTALANRRNDGEGSWLIEQDEVVALAATLISVSLRPLRLQRDGRSCL
jgi:hypothetical protein